MELEVARGVRDLVTIAAFEDRQIGESLEECAVNPP
jgi:hypothetical protein